MARPTNGNTGQTVPIADCPALAETLRILFTFLDGIDWGLPAEAARPCALFDRILAAGLAGCNYNPHIHAWTISFRLAAPVAPRDACRWYIFGENPGDPGNSVLVDLVEPDSLSTSFIQLGLCGAGHPPFVLEGLRLAGWGRPFSADDADLAECVAAGGVMDEGSFRSCLTRQGHPRPPEPLLLD